MGKSTPKKKPKDPPEVSQVMSAPADAKKPVLVRDHTVRLTSSVGVEADKFHDLVSAHLKDLRCVQVHNTKTFDITFCSVASAKKLLEAPAVTLGNSHFLVSPVDKPRIMVKITGLPFEIPQADVIETLSQYGEVFFSDRVKYKNRAYDNGDRLYLMHLTQNIPRYIEVYGFEGNVYHPKQEISCNYCKESGHVRQHCEKLVCRVCGGFGHFSFSCPRRFCKACQSFGHWARQCPNPEPPEDDPPEEEPPDEHVSDGFKSPMYDSPVDKPDCPMASAMSSDSVIDADPFSDTFEQVMPGSVNSNSVKLKTVKSGT